MTNQDNYSSKINSLLQLVDDPDEEVFQMVKKELLSHGKNIIEPLELLWDITLEPHIQKRIENIIHDIQFSELLSQWKDWKSNDGNILEALILIAKYKYPNLDDQAIRKKYQKLKQDIWLELNNYLSPLEEIGVINGIYFNYYNQTGIELHHAKEETFYINQIFENKTGNSYTNATIIASILEELDVPIRCIQLPHQFLLAYFETLQPFHSTLSEDAILKLICYMDPNNGSVYVQEEINQYFKKIGEPMESKYFTPLGKLENIKILLQEWQFFLDQKGKYDNASDIQIILNILNDEMK